MRTSDQTEAGLESSNATFLEDAAQNADLYILLPIKTSVCKFRSMRSTRTCIALADSCALVIIYKNVATYVTY